MTNPARYYYRDQYGKTHEITRPRRCASMPYIFYNATRLADEAVVYFHVNDLIKVEDKLDPK